MLYVPEDPIACRQPREQQNSGAFDSPERQDKVWLRNNYEYK